MKNMTEKMDEANRLLEELDLLSELRKFGRAEVVGSVALDLIVKPDLDIHLLIEGDELYPTTSKIMTYLIDQKKINEVRLTDWRSEGGLKIGVDAYPMDSGDWSIDIWVTNDPDATAFEFVRQVNAALTQEQRTIIREIKSYYYKQGLLRDGLSLRIYNAVMKQDISSIEEFITMTKEGVV